MKNVERNGELMSTQLKLVSDNMVALTMLLTKTLPPSAKKQKKTPKPPSDEEEEEVEEDEIYTQRS